MAISSRNYAYLKEVASATASVVNSVATIRMPHGRQLGLDSATALDPLTSGWIVRIPKEHLDRPLERHFWPQKAEIYPQKYPRYPQQDARSRMAISDSCQSQPRRLALYLPSSPMRQPCSALVIRFNRPRKTLPCRSRSNQREPVKSAAPAENLIRPVPVNAHDLANNPGRIRRHWR